VQLYLTANIAVATADVRFHAEGTVNEMLQIPALRPAIITLVGIPPAVVITLVPVTWQTVGVEE